MTQLIAGPAGDLISMKSKTLNRGALGLRFRVSGPPKVCKIMALSSSCSGFGALLYIVAFEVQEAMNNFNPKA